MTVVFNERIVFLVVDLEHNNGVGQLGELDGFLEEADPSLLEGDPPDSVI